MPVEIPHVRQSVLPDIGAEHPVGVLRRLGIQARQPLIHRRRRGPRVGKIVHQHEFSCAVGTVGVDLHLLPARLRVQQRNQPYDDCHRADGKKDRRQSDSQTLSFLGYFDFSDGRQAGAAVLTVFLHGDSHSLERMRGAAQRRSALTFDYSNANTSIKAKNRMITASVIRPAIAPFLHAL